MKNIRYAFLSLLSMFLMSITTFAQIGGGAGGGAGTADNASTVASNGNIASALVMIGFAIAAGLGALGQARIGAAAVEGAARNPSAAGRIQTMMILGLALIESLVLFALLIAFTRNIIFPT